MAGCWGKEGMVGLCNCCRWVEACGGGKGKGEGSGREGRAERDMRRLFCLNEARNRESPEPRAHLRPAGRRSVQGREGWWRCQRREMVLSWTMKGGGWPVAREGGVGSLVVPMANKQARRAGLAGKPPKVRPKFEQEQRTSGKQKGDRILAPHSQPGTREPQNRPSVSSNPIQMQGRCDQKGPESGRGRVKGPDVESASPSLSCSVSNAPHPGPKWRKAAGWLP